MSDNTDLQPAYILHQRVWQESSFIVEAFTLNHGRVVMMAKGARTSRPHIRALYGPFRPLLLSWVGRSELKTLTGIEEAGQSLALEDTRLASAYYLNEIVLRLLGKEQAQQELFAHYVMALNGLTNNTAPVEAILRTFELQLLTALGICPDFSHCLVDGSDVNRLDRYRFFPDHGLALAEDEELTGKPGFSIESHLSLPATSNDPGVVVNGKTLIALAEHHFEDDDVLKQAKPLMRRIMANHLGDKPLMSREMFTSLAGFRRDE